MVTVPSNECAPNPVAGSGEQKNSTDTSTYLTYDGVKEPDWAPAAAHRYARHGFPVGPCAELAKHPEGHPREGKTVYRYGRPVVIGMAGKEPLTRHGMKDFSTNLEQVQQWWEQYPGANIGVRPPAGWVVLDIDPRNGGADTWEQINHGHTLPQTIVTLTGSGGWHWWFRLPYAGDIRGSAGDGIDVKTHRGYLVMPPSIHPDTQGIYLLQQWVNPDQVPQLPTWLRKHVYRPLPTPVAPRREGEHTGTGLVGAVSAAVEGQRNQMLFWAACRALADGLDLEQELTEAARGIGLDGQEIKKTLNSARNEMKGAA